MKVPYEFFWKVLKNAQADDRRWFELRVTEQILKSWAYDDGGAVYIGR